MPRWPMMVGIALGMVLAGAVLSVKESGFKAAGDRPVAGAVLSECDGALRCIVIQ